MAMNYLNQNQSKSGGANKNGAKPENDTMEDRLRKASPDATISTPPWMHIVLGVIGMFVAAVMNVIQMVTTGLAIYFAMTPNGTQVDHSSDPGKILVAVIIAVGAQLGVTFLVWRIDTDWKKSAGRGGGENFLVGYTKSAVHVVQHIDLVTAWGLISFGVDTAGDFTFIFGILKGVPPATMVIIGLIYMIMLYSLSTIAFVRSTEYIWAAVVGGAEYVKTVKQQAQGTNASQTATK